MAFEKEKRQEPTAEEVAASFRRSLEGVIDIMKALAPVAVASAEMIDMVALAMENDGQLRLLMREVAAASKSQR